MIRKFVSNTISIVVFRRIFLLFLSGKPTQAHTGGFSYQNKFTEHAQQYAPLARERQFLVSCYSVIACNKKRGLEASQQCSCCCLIHFGVMECEVFVKVLH